MSEPIGLTVLRKVVAHYQANPKSWTRGDGILAEYLGTDVPIDVIERETEDPCKDGCIHTMIMTYSSLVAGKASREIVAAQAVGIFCRHHNLKIEADSIWDINDHHCETAEDAIDFVQAAIDGQTAAHGKGKSVTARTLVAACTAFLAFILSSLPLSSA